ncbi:hypothetical protein pdam_00013575 [Pocillopora damicornis]|uniref:Uncharacterized protein n=1 Tax=Pocillopora damicornis TaxID=46731 RepID=A0A3M6U6F4_POCDA|nr:hypothetical protein pdam_00013575 [Pocillopora damicornis]
MITTETVNTIKAVPHLHKLEALYAFFSAESSSSEESPLAKGKHSENDSLAADADVDVANDSLASVTSMALSLTEQDLLSGLDLLAAPNNSLPIFLSCLRK